MLFCRVVFNCASSCSVAGLISSLCLSFDIWMSSRLCAGAISWFSAAKRTPALWLVDIVADERGRAWFQEFLTQTLAALVLLPGG